VETRILISNLWYTQRHIDKQKVIDLIRLDGLFDSPILLRKAFDDEIEIINGHHRITALWQSKHEYLTLGEFVLVYSESRCARFGRIKDSVAISRKGYIG